MVKTNRETIVELLSEYFALGDSYAYVLQRDKSAFAVGTMTLDDFQELNAENIEHIADYLIRHNLKIKKYGKWVWNKDHWECSVCGCGRYHDVVLGLNAAFCGRCGSEMQ